MTDSFLDRPTDPTDPETCGKLLGTLCAQLGETSRLVEESVARVCQSFSSIARRTKENAAHAAQAAGHAGEGGGDVMATARATISGLLGRMDHVRRAATEAAETVRRIEEIGAKVDRIQKSLGEVERVSNALRMLALNAKIEAVRAGTAGRAFGVVADETGELANAVRATSESVRGMVENLRQDVMEGARRMRTGLQDDLAAADLSRDEGAQALEALTRTHADMQELVSVAAANSERLAEDIEDAMTALQFQDAVNQQIEHVVDALHEVRAVLGDGDPGLAAELFDRHRERHTMHSERQVLDGTTGPNAGPSAPGSIELF